MNSASSVKFNTHGHKVNIYTDEVAHSHSLTLTNFVFFASDPQVMAQHAVRSLVNIDPCVVLIEGRLRCDSNIYRRKV